jgi:hypothetical protein
MHIDLCGLNLRSKHGRKKGPFNRATDRQAAQRVRRARQSIEPV